MTPEAMGAAIGIGVTLVIQTAAMFRWAGRIETLLREHSDVLSDHGSRILRLERGL